MFHLTRYKYIFFGISLLIIIPGLLALIVWHLNLGIDFTGGSTISYRFASNAVTADQVSQVFAQSKPKAQDLNVLVTKPIGNVIPANQYAYITFDKAIGKNINDEVLNRLRKLDPVDPTKPNSGAQPAATSYQVTYPGQTSSTALIVVQFDKAVSQADITQALQNLPKSDPPPADTITTTGSATPTANATANATKSATAAATATPKATGTATATATATPTTTPSANQYAVSVTNVTLGANGQTYQVNTQTSYTDQQLNTITFQLMQRYGPVYSSDHESVGGSISSDTARNAIFAVVLASLFILIYISIAFRKVGSIRQSARFGASAIIALLHDALVVLGLWAIFGHFFGFKVDSLFLTAILTVIGFSVHDTIVVFDRIRENMGRRTAESFDTVVNASLVQTMTRSLNTSLTVLFTLAALTLFGGESIREFTLALLIGIASGTYSSIFNASMILDVWETREYRNWFKRSPATSAAARPKRELVGSR